MSNVIRFPVRLHPMPLVTTEQVAVSDALNEGLCPHCKGRGVKIRMINPRGWFPSDYVSEPCPCGGDDENRIEMPEFDGAA